MKRVSIVGRTNLRPAQLEQLSGACDLSVYDTNVTSSQGEVEVIRRARSAEIAVVNAYTQVSSSVIGELPKLRTVISCSSGIDHVDLRACAAAGVNVRWFPGYCSRTLAEKAVAYVLLGLTRILPAIDNVRAGCWDYLAFQAREIPGRIVAVVGYGATGKIVHDLCRGLGFQVVAITSDTPIAELQEAFRKADAVTLHMDLNSSSQCFLNTSTLAWLKPDTIIVNNARGGLIDHEALYAWLAGHPAATAFLDTLGVEPMAQDDPGRRLPNVVVTPRIGWNSVESDEYLARETYNAVVTAIARGWTTDAGEIGSRLLLDQSEL